MKHLDNWLIDDWLIDIWHHCPWQGYLPVFYVKYQYFTIASIIFQYWYYKYNTDISKKFSEQVSQQTFEMYKCFYIYNLYFTLLILRYALKAFWKPL